MPKCSSSVAVAVAVVTVTPVAVVVVVALEGSSMPMLHLLVLEHIRLPLVVLFLAEQIVTRQLDRVLMGITHLLMDFSRLVAAVAVHKMQSLVGVVVLVVVALEDRPPLLVQEELARQVKAIMVVVLQVPETCMVVLVVALVLPAATQLLEE